MLTRCLSALFGDMEDYAATQSESASIALTFLACAIMYYASLSVFVDKKIHDLQYSTLSILDATIFRLWM
ncbi:MAG: hypothetical protein K8L91_01955 [Anaerolineae bacterium]|nr:hypothetical protein [Anaerolineae bacterium]